ncbi:Ubiquitin-conjugating enzyme E2 J1 [Phytophthora pseudosyringae]|uniref:Ubiquitin-conjugating enzyme E2 J1 n=1 Tax=Phytophthora pseudosyringae TaxID=221518 RepID=A0A8T1W0Y8_9STRA|nr:Ubiquitin-conjugating enzyme E2 J1 [Phytophthora pseudosyringae]
MAASVRNTAIKRIQGDVREMMTNPSDQYAAAPLEVSSQAQTATALHTPHSHQITHCRSLLLAQTNMFDWHFTLRGPRDTEFEGGIYHGRIILPSDYPFKPPNIMLLTPNGRFEVKKKICLSISAYHPEEWQPAWGVRLILEALISFMPTKGEGAIGALDFPAEERRRLAKLSVDYKCDTCGRVADLLPEMETENEDAEREKKPSKYAEQIAQLHMHSLESASSTKDKKANAAAEVSEDDKQEASAPAGAAAAATPTSAAVQEETSVESKSAQTEASESAASTHTTATAPAASAEEPAVAEAATPEAPEPHQNVDTPLAAHNIAHVRESDSVDTFLHYLTVAIVVALFALVYKKLLQMHGVLQ